MKASEQEIFKSILNDLKLLKYDFGSWEEEWIEDTLFTQSAERSHLLCWILQKIFPSEDEDKPNINSLLFYQKVLAQISAIGLCRSSDLKLIEGTAPIPHQLEFWKRIVTFLLNINQPHLSGLTDTKANYLLEQISKNNTLPLSSKDREVMFLPAHLRTKYKLHLRNLGVISLQNQLEAEENHILNQSRVHLDKISLEADEEDVNTLCENVKSLTNSCSQLSSIYKARFSPWIKNPSAADKKTDTVGPVVKANYDQLKSLFNIISESNKLQGCMKELRNSENLSNEAISILESIIVEQHP